MVRPSSTPTASPTPRSSPTPAPPTATPTLAPTATFPLNYTPPPAGVHVTPQPGLSLVTLPNLADYVFQVDPAAWQQDPETGGLVHQRVSGCQVAAAPGHGLFPPQRLLWEDYGRFRWEILDYGAYAYVSAVLGGGLNGQGAYLEMKGYNRSACWKEEEQILTDLIPRQEAAGQATYHAFQAPTPRPNPEGFSCPNTPPARLRVGDYLSVVTDGLWLRSDPRADGDKIRKFLRYAPYEIKVIGGPVCDKYVYWQVQVNEFGEGVTPTQGWLAEGDPSETYVIPVK